MSNENDKRKSKWEASGLFIPAGLFIGMGIGWVVGHFVEAMFIGLGCGFALLALTVLIFKK